MAEKQMDPDAIIVARQFEKRIVDRVDQIVHMARGERDEVKTESDWLVVDELMRFFVQEWPHEFVQFRDSIKDVRASRNSGGYSKSKEIKYTAAIPPRMERLLKVVFTHQTWDKKFIYNLIRRYPLLKVGGEQ